MRKPMESGHSRYKADQRRRANRQVERPAPQEVSIPTQEPSPGSDEAYLDEMLKQTFPASDPLPYEPRERRTKVTPQEPKRSR